jgi:predicted nucleotidyltransferase
MGSLARGSFSEVASDIDIGIILKGSLNDAQSKIDSILSKSVENYTSVNSNVSIFWGSIESINGITDAGRYPHLIA